MIPKNLCYLFSEIINLVAKMFWIYLKSSYHLIFGYPQKDIKNNVIVITGAAHGLGRELAKLLAAKQAKIGLIDVNKTNCINVEKEIEASGGIAKGYHCDITDEINLKKTINKIENDLGPIDILINNAGVTNCLVFDDISPEKVRKTFEVNTFAHFWSIQAVLKQMIDRKKGHIVAISSIAGLIGTTNLVDYCASKFATVGLMEALDQEIHQNGKNLEICLTTICPLVMATGMFQHPKSRFPKLFPILSVSEAAVSIVDAILTERFLVTLPKYLKLFYQIRS